VPPDKAVRPLSHRRKLSTGSASSSDYSLDSITDDGLINFATPTRESPKRPRQSEERKDRRRSTAQLERSHRDATQASHFNAIEDTKSNPSNNLRSRRGLKERIGNLALPASADTVKHSYLTPPSTAPIPSGKVTQPAETTQPMSGGHYRSQSDTLDSTNQSGLYRGKSSGEVGTVGIVRRSQLKPDNTPTFQQPRSRSLSPRDFSDASDSNTGHDRTPTNSKVPKSISTPKGGRQESTAQPVIQSGDIQPLATRKKSTRVSGPGDFVQQTPSPPFSPIAISSYLNYQPGMSGVTLGSSIQLI